MPWTHPTTAAAATLSRCLLSSLPQARCGVGLPYPHVLKEELQPGHTGNVPEVTRPAGEEAGIPGVHNRAWPPSSAFIYLWLYHQNKPGQPTANHGQWIYLDSITTGEKFSDNDT